MWVVAAPDLNYGSIKVLEIQNTHTFTKMVIPIKYIGSPFLILYISLLIYLASFKREKRKVKQTKHILPRPKLWV